MKIGELATRAGLRPSAIRFYERAGVLPAPLRRNGQRHFTSEAEHYLTVIEIARKAGFTMAEIRLLFHGFGRSSPASARWQKMAAKKSREIEVQIGRLQQMRKLLRKSLQCRCMRLEDCGRVMAARSSKVRE